MGSAFRILNAGNEHIVKQSQIDAARVVQKARNAAQLSLVESKKIVQAANNAASQSFATARRQVQSANNSAEEVLYGSNVRLQNASNALSATVTSSRRQIQATSNSVARAQMKSKLAIQAKFNDEAIQVAEARKVLQAARNERAAVETDVANWTVSLRNKQRTDAMGKQVNALQEQINAALDSATFGRAFDRIANSETLGATIANAAAAGVGGSSVEAFNSAMSLRQAMREEREDREIASRVQFARRQQADAMGEAYNGFGGFGRAQLDREVIIAEQDNTAVFDEQNFDAILDNQNYDPLYRSQDYGAIIADQDFEVFTPDLDFTQYVDHKKMSGLQQVTSFIGAGVATYFGGPQAGAAVLDASMAINDMQNGNFAGAQQGFTNAFGNATQGWKTYRAGATNGGQGAAWGANLFKSKPVSGYNSDVGTVNFGASLKLGG